MTSFQVRFSDGKTSRLFNAEVTFQSQSLSINYYNEFSVLQHIRWDIDKINTTKFGVSFEHKLTYGDFPFETIEVDEDFYKHFHAYYPNLKLTNTSTDFIKKKTWKTILVVFAVITVFGAAMYFFVLPGLADQLAQSIPVEYEMKMGEEIYKQNMLTCKEDSARTKLVNEYFQTLHIKSPYKVRITVVDDPTVNAFAIPGGHIIVFSGILDQMKRHEELAGVLAHEYGHIYYRHSLRAMARSLANYTLISLVIGDVSGVAGVIVQNADYIKSLKYSRELEEQADNFGFHLLKEKGVNPSGMVWLFQTLTTIPPKIDIKVPEFLRSHPYTKKRIENMQVLLKKENLSTYKENDSLEIIWGQLKRESKYFAK